MSKSGRAPDYRDRPYAKQEEPARKDGSSATVLAPPKTMFEKYERVMQESFRSLCEAVAEIKNRHFYRQAGYDSFEECCEKRWGWTRQRGYQLANANATLKSLPSKCKPLVDNERTARAIYAVPKENRVQVLKQVSKAGPVTAKAISEAYQPPKQKAPIVIDVEPEKKAMVKHCPTCVCGEK